MNTTLNYVSALNKAYSIVEGRLNEDASKKDGEEKDRLVTELDNEGFIKVPFVGDFSSGKSSLINAMMGRDLLPTNILHRQLSLMNCTIRSRRE